MSSYLPQAAAAAAASSSSCCRSLSSDRKGTLVNEKPTARQLRLLNGTLVNEKPTARQLRLLNGPMVNEKPTGGELPFLKDIRECRNIPKPISILFVAPMEFEVTMSPYEGCYQGGTFVFSFHIPPFYPYEAPKVKCKTKVYHPNIDYEGNVGLVILAERWSPVLRIKVVLYQMYYLLVVPDLSEPLNHEAAAELKDNQKLFDSNVQKALSGLCRPAPNKPLNHEAAAELKDNLKQF